jgi:hypothetical protein
MPKANDTVTLEEVLQLARRLSSVDKVRLIEHVAPEIERDLTTPRGHRSRSLLGLLKDFGPAPSADEIELARQETWANFPRDDL